jgi:hypothetical protein
MNDLEIQQAADSAIDHGSKLRKKLSDVFSKEEKQAKETAQADIDAMQKAAKNLKARVDDGKPASGEAGVFSDSVKKVQASLGSRTLQGDAKTASDGISAAVAKVQQAFGMSASSEPASTTPPATGGAGAAAAPATAAPATAAPATATPPADTAAPATPPAPSGGSATG